MKTLKNAFAICVFAVSASLLASGAYGQEKAAAAPAAKKADGQKAAVQATPPQKKGPANIEMPRPDDKDVSRDAIADEKRDEAIKMLKEIFARFQPGPRKADVMFQLAELFWEKSKYLSFKEMNDYQISVEDCHKKSKDPKLCDDLKMNTRQSEIYRKQALDIYVKIIKEYPDYPRKDEVLFVLGYNHYEMGKKAEGIKFYWDLIKQFPKSRFAPDSYLALGEHFFNSNEVFKAVQAYQKALAYKDPKIYVFALYKLAWCDFNLGEFDKGIEKLKQVIEIADAEQTKGSERSRIQLKREALNDMTLFFSNVDATDEARDYFLKVGGQNAEREMMRRLARIYDDQGKSDQAIKAYRIVINDFPNDPEAPDFQSAIVQDYKKMGNKEAVRKEIRRLVELYRPNSPWAKSNSEDKRAIAQAYDLTESALRDIVQEYHQEAQKTKDVKTYQLASDLYKEYLDNFAKAENAYRLRFYYAEILYALEDYEKASEQYGEVVKTNPKGEYSIKSAYNAVLALERVIDLEKKGAGHKALESGKIDEKKAKGEVKRDVKLTDMKLEKGKSYEAKEIPKNEKMLADACDRFTTLAPLHDEFFAVKFKAAHIYYKYNRFDEASKRFGEFIDRYPSNKYALSAADLIMDSYNIKEDWKNVHYWAKRFIAIKPLASQPDPATKGQLFEKHLQDVLEGAQFKVAMDIMDRDKNKEEAAVAFRVFVKDFPSSTHGLKALYNAMILYSDVAKLDLAIETGTLLLDKYAKETPGAVKPKAVKVAVVKKPVVTEGEDKTKKAEKSDEVDPIERTVYLVGTYYDKISDFKNAADYFERYYEKYPKGKTADDALYNASLFREAMGLTDRAIENFGRYVKDFPTAKDTVDIQFRIGKIYQKKEDWVKAKAILQGFIEKYGKQVTTPRLIEAEYELVTVLQKMDQDQAAFKEIEKLLKIADGLKPGEANEKTFYYIASSKFQLLQPDYHNFMNIKLELPQSVMKQNLKIKSEKLAKLTESFTEVLKLGQGDMGIAALCRIGQMYQNFARALFDAPVPKNLNEEQREIYTAELQNLAFPVEEKAIEAFEKALSKMYELGIYNEWATTAQENLNKYKPGTYPDLPPTIYVAKEYFYQAPYLGSLKAQPIEEPKAKPVKAPEAKAEQAQPAAKEAAEAPKAEMKDSGKK